MELAITWVPISLEGASAFERTKFSQIIGVAGWRADVGVNLVDPPGSCSVHWGWTPQAGIRHNGRRRVYRMQVGRPSTCGVHAIAVGAASGADGATSSWPNDGSGMAGQRPKGREHPSRWLGPMLPCATNGGKGGLTSGDDNTLAHKAGCRHQVNRRKVAIWSSGPLANSQGLRKIQRSKRRVPKEGGVRSALRG